MLAEAVTNPDHAARRSVAAKLISKAGRIVDIELGANEDMFRQIYLNTDAGVQLKMARIADRFDCGAAYCRPYATALCDCKARSAPPIPPCN